MAVCIATMGLRVEARFQQTQTPALSANDQAIMKTFEKRAKEYVKLREQLEEQMPKLSKEAKAEEIQNHKKQFQERVRAARAGAKHGDVFTPEAATLIRAIIKEIGRAHV